MNGTTFKRCPQGKTCPDLRKRHHGSWFFAVRIDTSSGRKLVRRGGYAKESDAAAVLARITELMSLAPSDAAGKLVRAQIGDMILSATLRAGQLPERSAVAARLGLGQSPGDAGVTVGEWLDSWLAGRRRLRKSTVRSYEMHVRVWLKPHLGDIPLERLTAVHIAALLDTIAGYNAAVAAARDAGETPVPIEGDVRAGIPKVVSASTQARIFATLRAALNAAVKQRRIAWNPCAGVELERPEPRAPQAWTPGQARSFISHTASDPLGLMFRIAVLRGARRGELCGFRWACADLEAGTLIVDRTILELGGQITEGKPKTRAGERKVFLDDKSATLLREHRKAQLQARMLAGQAWADNDLVFCQADGSPWHPDYVSKRFRALAREAGVPDVRLHDGGRHTGNSLMKAAGVDQELRMREIGHSDKATNDRYTHIMTEAHRAAANQTAALVDGAGAAS